MGGVWPHAQAEIYIDEIMVTVNGQAITHSKVELLRAYLAVTKGEGMGRPIPHWQSISVEDALRLLEEDSIMLSMSSRLSRALIEGERVEAQLQWFKAQFPDAETHRKFIETWGFDRQRQRAFFADRLRVSDFIDVKVGAFIAAPDAELDAFLEERRDIYGPITLESDRERLSLDYARYRRGERYEAWIRGYMNNHREAVRIPAQKPSTEHSIP